MDVRYLLAGILLCASWQSVAGAQCPDQTTAAKGYKFEDNAGATGEQQTQGTEQLAVIKSPGRELRQRFINNGQFMVESTTVTDKLTLQLVNTLETLPPMLDAVGQSSDFGWSTRSGDGPTSWFYTRRKVVGAERVTIGECAYDTLVIVAETESTGEVARKQTMTANWSPVLAKYVKADITMVVLPANKPVVTNWMLVRVGL